MAIKPELDNKKTKNVRPICKSNGNKNNNGGYIWKIILMIF